MATKTKGTKFKYEINLINPSNDYVYSDVHYTAFVRTPIIKQASFCVIQMNLPYLIVREQMEKISQNMYNVWKMEIYTIDENNNNKINVIFSKQFVMLSVLPLEKEYFQFLKPDTVVKIVLANPILYSLSTTNGFNEIMEDVTAYGAIKKYEKYLKENYGQFKFNHVGTSEKLNRFLYEQIFTPPTIDTLNIPKYIINTFKPFDSYNTYFFDDFYLTPDSNEAITAHFLNFYNIKNHFKPMSMGEYPDYAFLTRRFGKTEFTDQFRSLDTPNSTSTFINKNISFVSDQSNNATTPQTSTSNVGIAQIYGRKDKVPKYQTIQNKQKNKSVRAKVIYTPDNDVNAAKRIQVAQELMFYKFEHFCFYQTDNCLPDWMQFGKIYDMESDNREAFLYTPLSIINIFHRTQEKEKATYCYHMMKYCMMKLMNDDDNITSVTNDEILNYEPGIF